MNKQELIKSLKLTRNNYSNEDSFRGGVRTGLGIALGEIEKLEKPEKVVIPQFVADWWEANDNWVILYRGSRVKKKSKLYLITKFYERGLDDYLSKVEDWIHKNHSSFLDLVNEKPYEIEKEKLYRVDMYGTTDVALLTLEGDEYYFDEPLDYVGERPDIRQEFTESEIKAIDERYWLFAVEV